MEASPFPFFDVMAAKFGGIFYYYLGPVPRLVITDPLLIRSFFVLNSQSYEKTSVAKAFTLFGKGLLLASGDSWAQQRKLLNPAFNHAEIKVRGAWHQTLVCMTWRDRTIFCQRGLKGTVCLCHVPPLASEPIFFAPCPSACFATWWTAVRQPWLLSLPK